MHMNRALMAVAAILVAFALALPAQAYGHGGAGSEADGQEDDCAQRPSAPECQEERRPAGTNNSSHQDNGQAPQRDNGHETGSADPEDRQPGKESRAAYCRDHPDDPGCRGEQEQREAQQKRFEEYCEEHPSDPYCREHRAYTTAQDDTRDRLDSHCEEHPDEPRCQAYHGPPDRPPAAAPVPAFAACQREAESRAGDDRRTHLEALELCCRQHTEAGSPEQRRCQALQEAHTASRDQTHIRFEVMDDASGLRNFTVGGVRVMDAARYDSDRDGFAVHAQGARTEFRLGSEASLVVHDTPTGFLSFQPHAERAAEDPAALRVEAAGPEAPGVFTMRFPEGTLIHPAPAGLRVEGDGFRSTLTGASLEVNGTQVSTNASVRMHLQPAAVPTPLPMASPERVAATDQVRAGIEQGRIGAEVDLRRAAVPGEGTSVQVRTYDDLRVSVQAPEGPATREAPLRVEFDADLHEGRTVVLDLDLDLVVPEGVPAEQVRLELRYFNVHDDGRETEVLFRQAGSLEDVLDAGSDGQPRYWIVQDAHGLQVLVAVPHWSVHAVTLAGFVESVEETVVLVGLVVGVMGTLLAALGLFRPRRPASEAAA